MNTVQSLLAYLRAIDENWFHLINDKWAHPSLDWFFTNITDLHRDPRAIYILIPVLLFWIWKSRMLAVKSIVTIGITVALCDAAAYRGLKAIVQRPRPPDAGIALVLRTHRYSGSSFPSNHATNMFGAAMIVSLLFPGAGFVAFPIAALVGYSRVYVGVHYPFDVLCGAILGMLIGYLTWLVFRAEIGRTRRAQIESHLVQPSSDRAVTSTTVLGKGNEAQ